jgi:hypothetical protein
MTTRSSKTVRDASAPKEPEGMGRDGSALWKRVTDTYSLRSDEATVLEDACRASDMIARLREELREMALMTTGSTGQDVVNPAVAEIRAQQAHRASLLARLKLKDVDEGQGKGNPQRDNGSKRWQVPTEADGAAS